MQCILGDNNEGQCNVSGWTDIVAISAGTDYTVGLKADGTVVFAGENDKDQCNVLVQQFDFRHSGYLLVMF